MKPHFNKDLQKNTLIRVSSPFRGNKVIFSTLHNPGRLKHYREMNKTGPFSHDTYEN